MLRSARSSVARCGLAKHIVVEAGTPPRSMLREAFGVQGFDRVFISYALSMIPSWPDVVKKAAACVAPGGVLLIVDFGDFSRYPGFVRGVQLSWLRRFSIPIPAFESKIKTLADEIGFTATTTSSMGANAIQARLERR